MNVAIISGRLVKDITIVRTKNDIPLAKFTLAVNNYGSDKTETTFLDCLAYKKCAEMLEKRAHKGDKILVYGKVVKSSYQDKTGRTIYITQIIVSQCELPCAKKYVGSADEQLVSEATQQLASSEEDENTKCDFDVNDDDLPF